jgi:hypothetical protein
MIVKKPYVTAEIEFPQSSKLPTHSPVNKLPSLFCSEEGCQTMAMLRFLTIALTFVLLIAEILFLGYGIAVLQQGLTVYCQNYDTPVIQPVTRQLVNLYPQTTSSFGDLSLFNRTLRCVVKKVGWPSSRSLKKHNYSWSYVPGLFSCSYKCWCR